jgi:hypothetical protein
MFDPASPSPTRSAGEEPAPDLIRGGRRPDEGPSAARVLPVATVSVVVPAQSGISERTRPARTGRARRPKRALLRRARNARAPVKGYSVATSAAELYAYVSQVGR